jgi:hypothetical protein
MGKYEVSRKVVKIRIYLKREKTVIKIKLCRRNNVQWGILLARI